MENEIHFKGFSACSKCTGRFAIWVDPENPSQHEPVHQARILFRIGDRPNDLQNFFKVLEEFDQQRIMPRCCLLVNVLSNDPNYGTSSILLDAEEPENGRKIAMAYAESPGGYDFSPSPSHQELESGPVIERQTDGSTETESHAKMVDEQEQESQNVAHCGSNVSKAPTLEELRSKPLPLGVAEGGYEFSAEPSFHERHVTTEPVDTAQTVIDAGTGVKQKNNSSTNKPARTKRRKSNRSQKSKAKRNLTNSF